MPKSKTAAEELSKWLNKRVHNELRIKKWEDFLNKLSPKQKYHGKTLNDLIYYGKINGGKLEPREPSSKDINQGGWIFAEGNNSEYTQFGSCGCLATLMGMAKRDSKSIRKLIQPHPSRYDAVVVKLKNVKPKWKVKPYYDASNAPAGCDIIFDFEPSGNIDKIITAEELCRVCSGKAVHHRRLWPSVVEIALAKAMKADFISFQKINETELSQCEDFVRQGYALKVADFYIKALKDTGNKISPDSEKFRREIILQGSLTDQEIEDYVKKHCSEELRDKYKKEIKENYTTIKKIFEDSANELEGDIVTQINDQFCSNEGYCCFFNTALTGKKSRMRIPLNFEACRAYERAVEEAKRKVCSLVEKTGYFYAANVNHLPKGIMGKFSSRDGQKDKYTPQELRLFEKIKKQLGNGQVITVAFTKPIRGSGETQKLQGSEKPQLETQASDTLKRFEPIKGKNGKLLFKDKEGKYGEMTKEELKKWAETDFEQRKLEKRKAGITVGHAYSVVGAFSVEAGDEVTAEEKPTYKFIVIEDPHNEHVSINYRAYSECLSKTAKQFLQKNKKLKKKERFYINNSRTCIMELNHFAKLLSIINYSRKDK